MLLLIVLRTIVIVPSELLIAPAWLPVNVERRIVASPRLTRPAPLSAVLSAIVEYSSVSVPSLAMPPPLAQSLHRLVSAVLSMMSLCWIVIVPRRSFEIPPPSIAWFCVIVLFGDRHRPAVEDRAACTFRSTLFADMYTSSSVAVPTLHSPAPLPVMKFLATLCASGSACRRCRSPRRSCQALRRLAPYIQTS